MFLILKTQCDTCKANSSLGKLISDCLVLNTGVPQGCILSPLLFSTYTNEVKYNSKDLSLIKYDDKYAYDMALAACLQDVNSVSYSQHIDHLAAWFDSSFLDLDVSTTKELCLGGRMEAGSIGPIISPAIMKGQEVEQVTHFKHLGTIIDNKLTFQINADYIYKKAWQQLSPQEIEFQCQQTHPDHGLQVSVLTFNIIS